MLNWVNGKIYPQESGYYEALFISGKKRIAYFTLITTPNENRKSYGRWGTTHPTKFWENYIPLIDPIAWQPNLCQSGQKTNKSLKEFTQ